MTKLNKSLIALIIVAIVAASICLFGLRSYVIELDNRLNNQNYKIANKDLQLSILWKEINSAKEINAEMNNKNRELRGYNNFLESQNEMLMDNNHFER